MTQSKFQKQNSAPFGACVLGVLLIVCLGFYQAGSAQQSEELEFFFDMHLSAGTVPKIFRPNVDLGGRGFHSLATWPQGMASPVALDAWGKDIGFAHLYRLQYNLWEINQFGKSKSLQGQLLANYDATIKRVNDAGGTVILTLFATPAGLGKALDKRSTPGDMKAFKAIAKQVMYYLSCEKQYTIWYEVWNTPDNDDFYVGRRQDYLALYRAVAEAASELKAEYKVYIPVGGPSTSWWFQNIGGNNILVPERSLIYELIRYCGKYRLPLDFISWHGYSTDPRVEQEMTVYRKTGIALIRDWLSYFRFNRDAIPLVVDEWNYDRSGINLMPERSEKSHIAASYIIPRLKHMYGAGLTNQIYYCLEDFQNNKEGVNRNVGVLWFDKDSDYTRGHKATFNVFRMLSLLQGEVLMLPSKLEDEFVDVVATKHEQTVAFILSNYCDPDSGINYISRNVGALSDGERKIALKLIRAGRLQKAINGETPIEKLRLTVRLRALLKKAKELQSLSNRYSSTERSVTVAIKNLKGAYLQKRYIVDASCSLNCEFSPADEQSLDLVDEYRQKFIVKPYSVTLVVLKPKPQETVSPPAETSAVAAPPAPAEQAPAQN